MTIYTDTQRRKYRGLEDFEVSTSDAMGAAFKQALFENPTTALMRISEIESAERGEITGYKPGSKGGEPIFAEPDSPLLSAEDARNRIAETGLDLTVPDTGIRERALDILIERKREEAERQFILSRAPAGSFPAQLAASFVASAIDPLNIASAFVPVYGEARYTALLSKATTATQRAAVRARVGAVEGAAGAAIVEPIVLVASERDQADYDMTDSLLNIAFGTVLGGGLHAGGGAIADWRRPSTFQVVNERLAEAGFAPDELDAYSRTTAAFIETQADILGITPEQFMQDYSFRVTKEEGGEFSFAQSAYHGTPHTFDKFSLDAIGTGEGAQAYGWGLYFAGKRQVAEFYREGLSRRAFAGDTTAKGIADRFFDGFDVTPESLAEAITEFKRRDTFARKNDPAYDGRFGSAAELLESGYTPNPRGNLYQVEIPEDELLLDWNKPISEQKEDVRAKLEAADFGGDEAVQSWKDTGSWDRITGEVLYRRLSDVMGQAEASKYLGSLGIPGLRYLDEGSRNNFVARTYYKGEPYSDPISFATEGQAKKWAKDKEAEGYEVRIEDGSHNYVIWDESRVTVEAVNDELRQARRVLEQGGFDGAPRGSISFNGTQALIRLGKTADASTFIHESGHLYLEVMRDMAKKLEGQDLNAKQKQFLKDLETVKEWTGAESIEKLGTKEHEQFARGFEAYTLTGDAPTPALKDVFERFKQWLSKIYHSMRDLDVELTPEITEVFDRMLGKRAKDIAKDAPHGTHVAAVKAGMSQMARGKPIDVEPVYTGQYRPESIPDSEAKAFSDRVSQMKEVSDEQLYKESAEYEEDIALETARQMGIDTGDEFAEAQALMAKAQSYQAAYKAAAVCGMRN